MVVIAGSEAVVALSHAEGAQLTSPTDRASFTTFGRRRACALGAGLVLVSFGLAGCGAISAARRVVHDVRGNKATIDNFTSKMSSTATFEATYVTTGASPAKIVYAVEPPQGLAFKDTPCRRRRQRGPHRQPDRRVLVLSILLGRGRIGLGTLVPKAGEDERR